MVEQQQGLCPRLIGTRAQLKFFLALGLAMLVLIQATAEPAVPPLTVCLDCRSDASFAYHAEQSAPYWAPEDEIVVTYPMYVIESWSGETRYFDVETWYDFDGFSYGDLPDDSGIAGFFTSRVLLGALHRHAEPARGDAALMNDIAAAHEAARDFLGAILHVDFSGQSWEFHSVMELIGSEGYSSLNQDSLLNMLNLHYQSIWEAQSAQLSQRVRTISQYLISQSNYIARHSRFQVTFPDGTQVRGDLKDLSATNGTVYADLALSMGTAVFPADTAGLLVVPTHPGHLVGLEYSPVPLPESFIPMLERLGADMSAYHATPTCDPMRFEERQDGEIAVVCGGAEAKM